MLEHLNLSDLISLMKALLFLWQQVAAWRERRKQKKCD